MWRRRFVLAAVLMLSFGSLAHAGTDVQLCGFTQFADLVVLSVTMPDGPRLLMTTAWEQFVPNLYLLLGGGATTRKPSTANQYVGGLTISNSSEAFAANPLCRVTPEIEQLPTTPVSYTGTAILLCVDGPNGPFEITLNLHLLACQEPSLPAVAEDFSVADETLQGFPHAPGQFIHELANANLSRSQALAMIHAQGLTAAGEAVNNEAR